MFYSNYVISTSESWGCGKLIQHSKINFCLRITFDYCSIITLLFFLVMSNSTSDWYYLKTASRLSFNFGSLNHSPPLHKNVYFVTSPPERRKSSFVNYKSLLLRRSHLIITKRISSSLPPAHIVQAAGSSA